MTSATLTHTIKGDHWRTRICLFSLFPSRFSVSFMQKSLLNIRYPLFIQMSKEKEKRKKRSQADCGKERREKLFPHLCPTPCRGDCITFFYCQPSSGQTWRRKGETRGRARGGRRSYKLHLEERVDEAAASFLCLRRDGASDVRCSPLDSSVSK